MKEKKIKKIKHKGLRLFYCNFVRFIFLCRTIQKRASTKKKKINGQTSMYFFPLMRLRKKTCVASDNSIGCIFISTIVIIMAPFVSNISIFLSNFCCARAKPRSYKNTNKKVRTTAKIFERKQSANRNRKKVHSWNKKNCNTHNNEKLYNKFNNNFFFKFNSYHTVSIDLAALFRYLTISSCENQSKFFFMKLYCCYLFLLLCMCVCVCTCSRNHARIYEICCELTAI